MQAAFQQHVDNAVSKTVNLSSDAKVAVVDKIYRLAFESGCKGITVYRDGCRPDQTLATIKSSESDTNNMIEPRPRTETTQGCTKKFRMGCETLFVTVNKDDQGLCEVFANLGKAGGCPSQSEATCRVVSSALRAGVDPKVIIDQLRGIRCLSTAMARHSKNNIEVLSCPDAIARAMENALGEIPKEHLNTSTHCPECGMDLTKEAGCMVCTRCGFSKCG